MVQEKTERSDIVNDTDRQKLERTFSSISTLQDEWRRLRPVTANGPERHGMAGVERAMLYATAIQTGLRASELRSLTRGQLFLNGDQRYITC